MRSDLKTERHVRLAVRHILSEDGPRADMYHNHLEEKEKQSATVTDLFGDDADSSDDDSSGDKPKNDPNKGDDQKVDEPSKSMSDETDKLESGDISVDDIIEKLNAIRSGKSLKDDSLKQQMDQYVNSLKQPEKVALMAFLKGIAQLVTGEFTSQQATNPETKPADVHMHKKDKPSPDKKERHVDPNVIKSKPTTKPVSKGGENTSAPVPITPKKK